MILDRVQTDLQYPYVAGQMMRQTILIEQGILEYHRDWSGWTSLTQNEE